LVPAIGLAELLVSHATDIRSIRALSRLAGSSRANREAIVDAKSLAVFVSLLANDDSSFAEAKVLLRL
jgi:hypothetical protein